ncbi:hypothetical protein AWZ03_013858, partial [Drosophila navojoa]
ARGYPEPIVNWRREDGSEIVLKDNAGTKTLVSSFRGEVLKLTKISRNEMGSYLCIASNGVPPSVSKRISLSIHCNKLRALQPPDKARFGTSCLPQHVAQVPSTDSSNIDTDTNTNTNNDNGNDYDYDNDGRISLCVFPRHLLKFPALLGTFLHD